MSGERRLLCDEMLAALARWLRAAGHDAALAGAGTPDERLLRQAAAENRVLLTRDKRLAEAAGAIRLPDGLEAQAALLRERLGLDWLHAPFTRCMTDGTPLVEASAADLQRIPAQSRALPGPFTACPNCGRVYWPGSHVRRMRTRLTAWAQQL